MKNLTAIVKKYSAITFNEENYEVGGGLTFGKYASNRHEDAKNDKGKLTLGKAAQMFKKATQIEDIEYIKEIIQYAIPNMEWHHAGKLPKQYGGGMKKTYFLNSNEIVKIAEEWDSTVEKLELSKAEKRKSEEQKKNREQLKLEFLNENAEKVVRVETKPLFFHETDKEMNGKFGWFSSYGKSYNMKEYYTGWKFKSEEKHHEFYNL